MNTTTGNPFDTIGLLMSKTSSFFGDLDWIYILTYLVIAYFFTHKTLNIGQKIDEKVRVLGIGVIWMVAIYFLRDYPHIPRPERSHHIEMLVASLFVGAVMYSRFFKALMEFTADKSINMVNKFKTKEE